MGWLTGWQYRKSHQIVGSTAGAVTDYQIRVKVYYGSGTDSGENVYLNGKCRTDFGDIRFTASDGTTLLNYWMEEKVDSNYAIFWVKVPSIPASPDTVTIYIYYGKSDATTTSSGDATFIIFDDFNDGVVDTNKWEIFLGYGTTSVTEHDGMLDIYKNWNRYTGTPSGVRSLTTFSNYNIEMITRVKFATLSGDGATGVFIVNLGTGYQYAQYVHLYYDTHRTEVTTSKGSSIVAHSSAATNTWYIYKIQRPTQTTTKWYLDTTLLRTDTTYSEDIGVVQLELRVTRYANEHLYVDYVYIRKYVEPEPTHGIWGSEETYVETIIANNFPMLYLQKPIKAQELKSKIEGGTISTVAKNFPEELIKKGKAQELRSKFS